MKQLLLTLIAFLFSFSVFGQTGINIQAVWMVDSIKASLCAKDTLKTIEQLERMQRNYPTDGMIRLTNKILGDLYLDKGKTKLALRNLIYALHYQPTTYSFFQDSTSCDKVFNSFFFSRSKADICVSISRAYIIEKKLDSSLIFLKLADDKYLPYKGCGNGIIMYRSYLSTYFANQYLAMGDTAKAIGRLLDFCMLPDGNMERLTEKLRQILLTKFTPSEIKTQVEDGIKTLKIVKGGKEEPDRILEFTLFGHVIRSDASEEPLAFWKKRMRNRESIRQLIQ